MPVKRHRLLREALTKRASFCLCSIQDSVVDLHECKNGMWKALALHSITQTFPSIVHKSNAAVSDHAVRHAEHNDKILSPVAVTPDASCPAF